MPGGDGTRSYFDNSVAAYALGLGLCFAVNFISRSGQPGVPGLNVRIDSSTFAPLTVVRFALRDSMYTGHGSVWSGVLEIPSVRANVSAEATNFRMNFPYPPPCFVSVALLYLNPALLGSAFATALLNGNGELQELLSFGIGEDSDASEED